MKFSLGPRRVETGRNVYIAHNATVIGSVHLADECSVWFNAVIRGDNDLIGIGERSNIQDGAVLHTDTGVQLLIGAGVTIGHQVTLHGCSIGDGSLIGIKSVVLNNVKIGRSCLVGANALITEGKEFPDRSLIIGAPAKAVRTLTDEEVARLAENAEHYVRKIATYREQFAAQD